MTGLLRWCKIRAPLECSERISAKIAKAQTEIRDAGVRPLSQEKLNRRYEVLGIMKGVMPCGRRRGDRCQDQRARSKDQGQRGAGQSVAGKFATFLSSSDRR
jgi:hypothetical protein